MVKSETNRDTEVLVENPILRVLDKNFWDSKKKNKQTIQKRDFKTY